MQPEDRVCLKGGMRWVWVEWPWARVKVKGQRLRWDWVTHMQTLLKHSSQSSGNVETPLRWAQHFFFSDKVVNNTTWLPKLNRECHDQITSAQNAMICPLLQRVKLGLHNCKSVGLWDTSEPQVSLNSLANIQCQSLSLWHNLSYFCSSYYIWKYFKVNVSFQYRD